MKTLNAIRDWITIHHADEPTEPVASPGCSSPDTYMPCTWLYTFALCVPVSERASLPGRILLLPEDAERVMPLDRAAIKAEVAEAIARAWWQVCDHHMFTVRTVICECSAWLWVLGEDDLSAWCMDPANWPMMGVPVLRRVAEHLGIEERHTGDWGDRMARGEPCCEGCRECARYGRLGVGG